MRRTQSRRLLVQRHHATGHGEGGGVWGKREQTTGASPACATASPQHQNPRARSRRIHQTRARVFLRRIRARARVILHRPARGFPLTQRGAPPWWLDAPRPTASGISPHHAVLRGGSRLGSASPAHVGCRACALGGPLEPPGRLRAPPPRVADRPVAGLAAQATFLRSLSIRPSLLLPTAITHFPPRPPSSVTPTSSAALAISHHLLLLPFPPLYR